jgi:hypothetical protein
MNPGFTALLAAAVFASVSFVRSWYPKLDGNGVRLVAMLTGAVLALIFHPNLTGWPSVQAALSEGALAGFGALATGEVVKYHATKHGASRAEVQQVPPP